MLRTHVALIICALLTSVSAFADGFELIQHGKTYWCEARTNDPTGAVACAGRAQSGPFNSEQSSRLCAGATTEAPAFCAIQAYRGPFSIDQAVTLCASAYSTAPAECAEKAYRGPFTQEQAVRLCRRAQSVAPADCAIEAYRGPYSTDQAVALCSGNSPQLMTSVLKTLNENTSNLK